MDQISIVVPVYNAELYLNDCIESLCNQTYSNIEIILIDDGSTDTSKEICTSYAKKDSRIRFLSQPNSGVSVARNTGMACSSGAYIAFVDSDDFVAPDYCEQLLRRMTPNIDMVVTGLYRYSSKGQSLISHRLKNGVYKNSTIRDIVIDDGTFSGFTLHSPCGVLYKSSVIKEHKLFFKTDIRYNEDGLFNAEYVFHSNGDLCINYADAFYYYRVNPQSATHQIDMLGLVYTQNMQRIESELLKYSHINIQKQFAYRKLSVAFFQIVWLARNNRKLEICNIVNDEQFVEALRTMVVRRLPIKKKIAYYLLKTRNVTLISAVFGIV